MNPKFKFLGIILFCFLHLYRDHLQIQQIHNKFTDTGHDIYNSPKHEKDGMLLLGVLAAFCLYFYEKDEEKEVDARNHTHIFS